MASYNPYEYMIGGQVPDEVRTKSLAENLRGQDSRALLALISGDPALARVGQALSAQSRSTAGGLAKVREAINRAQQQQALQDERLAHQAEQGDLNRDLRWRIANLEKEKAATRAENELNKNTRRLSEKLESTGVTEAEKGIADLFTSLEKVGALNKEGGLVGDIPGQGAGKYNPNFMVSQDAKNIRMQLSSVRNKLLKLRSGAAVTTPEMDRLIEELGTGVFGTDQDLVNSLTFLKDSVQTIKSSLMAGYDPEVVQTYLGRLENEPTYSMDMTPPQPSSGTGGRTGQMGRTRSGAKVEIIE